MKKTGLRSSKIPSHPYCRIRQDMADKLSASSYIPFVNLIRAVARRVTYGILGGLEGELISPPLTGLSFAKRLEAPARKIDTTEKTDTRKRKTTRT